MYESLTRLFNKIATIVSRVLDFDDEPVVFYLSPKTPPVGQSRQEDHLLTPDILVLPPRRDFEKFTHVDAKGELRIPWAALESVVEVKTKKDWNHQQVVDYMETLLQHRPDKVYSLGLSCNQYSYRFYYTVESDPGLFVHFSQTLPFLQFLSASFVWDSPE